MSQNDIPQTHDPLTVTTLDGTRWVRSGLTRSGRGLYAIEGATACPDHVMATLNELAEHGIRPLPQPLAPSTENVSPQVQKLRGILAGQRAATVPQNDPYDAIPRFSASQIARWQARQQEAPRVSFATVKVGDRIRFVTADNGYAGQGEVWRTGTVAKVTAKTVIVDCDENLLGEVAVLRGDDWNARAVQRAATNGALAEQRHLVDPLDHALEALAPHTQDGSGPMTLKPITFRLAPGALLGRLSADILRQTTLLSLVADWGDEETRENVIAVLDNLAIVASDPVDEAELRRRVLTVECVAEMDPADVSVSLDELLRLRAEMDRVINEIRSTHVLLVGRLG